MMVQKPEDWIEEMAAANVDQYTFHVEPCLNEVPQVCRKIREAGMKVGLAIKPKTEVCLAFMHVIEKLHLLQFYFLIFSPLFFG